MARAIELLSVMFCTFASVTIFRMPLAATQLMAKVGDLRFCKSLASHLR